MPVLTPTGGGSGASFISSPAGNAPGFPTQLYGLLQQGFLERELSEGLDSVLAYRHIAMQEQIPARIGETLTKSRKSRFVPVSSPINPSSNSGLDNGMTPGTFSMEQYQYTMQQWNSTSDVNLMEELTGIADQLIATARNNGVQAAQTIERIARLKLFSAYLGGNTVVLAAPAPTTTSVHVNDIRGFQNVLVNGQLTPVSAAAPLVVTELNIGGGGVAQSFSITGASADALNSSYTPDGVSGTLTISPAAGSAPVAGDALIAANAPKIFRPFGKQTSAQLAGQDVLTLSLIEDIVAYLRDNAVPPMADGTYHCLLDNTSLRQLFADQDFKVAYAGRYQSQEFQDQDIIRLLGVTYIPTTEAYVQPPISAGGPKIRRPIIVGGEALLEGDFEGLEIYLRNALMNQFAHVELVNGVVQVVRPPLDRLQQVVSLSWMWIGDFAVPTDITATSSIIPTASTALYKRAAAIEIAG